MLSASLYLHPADELMTIEVLRAGQKVTLHVPVATQKHDVDCLLDIADAEKNLVPPLNVIALPVDEKTARMLPGLRIPSGVIVVANTTFGGGPSAGAQSGRRYPRGQ